MNIYNNSKQAITKNVLPMEINMIFRINSNSFLADRREGTDFDTLSYFTRKNNYWFRDN